MDQLEDFLSHTYAKVMVYLERYWQESVDTVYAFDYLMLLKANSIIIIGYFLAKLLSKYFPKVVQLIGEKVNISIDTDFKVVSRAFIFQLIFFLFVLITVHSLELSEQVEFVAASIVQSILLLSFVVFSLRCVKVLLYRMANSPVDITSMPEGDNRQEVYIKEIPNLFGNGTVKKLTKVEKNPFKSKDKNEK